MIRRLALLALTGLALHAWAQVEVFTQAQVSAAMGDRTPLWLNANKYGLSSLDSLNGYVRAAVFRKLAVDSARKWGYGAGFDVVAGRGLGSNIVLHQAFAEVRWQRGVLTLGSKEQPVELKDQELSTGAQALGCNARPVPGVRLSLPCYWPLPYTHGWVALKGHIFYGMQTDDTWQQSFTNHQSKYTERTKLHTKAGYLRIGQEGRPLSVELGLEMGCQFGGISHVPDEKGMLQTVENEGGLKGMWHAMLPAGGDATETVYRNADGNHVGSWLLRVNYNRPSWGVSLYADHYFEDHSSMFFLDYNGYGQGNEWDEWKDRRWFLYDMKDALLGMEVRLNHFRYMNRVVAEYIYTKYQSGPLYHDHTPTMSDHVCGMDEYYNHSVFTGWQHWGQVMGNPLYRSPLYNTDGTIRITNNRFWAWHLGVSGDPIPEMHYRVLATLQRGWGTSHDPLPEPRYDLSLLFEGEYRFPKGDWSVKGALAMDFGGLLEDNIGAQVTVSKHLNIKTRRR